MDLTTLRNNVPLTKHGLISLPDIRLELFFSGGSASELGLELFYPGRSAVE